jgi:hypothetical protein
METLLQVCDKRGCEKDVCRLANRNTDEKWFVSRDIFLANGVVVYEEARTGLKM